MKNIIFLTYFSILLPVLGKIYNASNIIVYSVNGILFLSSVSLLFLIYMYEKYNNTYNHIIPLTILYILYNFMVNSYLGIYSVFIYFMIYNKYNSDEHNLEKTDKIIPLTFLFSNISKSYSVLVFSYFILLTFLAFYNN